MTPPLPSRPGRSLPVAFALVLAAAISGPPFISAAHAQDAPPPIRRNVGGYPVSSQPAGPKSLAPETPPASPAGSVLSAPARPPAAGAGSKPAGKSGSPKPGTSRMAPAPAPAAPSPVKPAAPHSTPGKPIPLKPATTPAKPGPQPTNPGARLHLRTISAPAVRTAPVAVATTQAPAADATAPAATMEVVRGGAVPVLALRAATLPASGAAITTTALADTASASPAPTPAKKSGSSKWRADPKFLPTVVPFDGPEAPGTVLIDTDARFLYLVEDGGTARRYGIGVGKPGFEWAGTHRVTRKAEWPDWRPPPEMIARNPKLPKYMAGGPRNPLGARALYLGSTLYRIHGSNEPWSIGRAVSSGCIRMRNEDVTDLYDRVPVGTTVIVR